MILTRKQVKEYRQRPRARKQDVRDLCDTAMALWQYGDKLEELIREARPFMDSVTWHRKVVTTLPVKEKPA